MLAAGRSRVDGPGSPRRSSCARAGRRRSPSTTATFDALTFTYLLRYVDDPAATLRELARVVRPGGTVAALEFGVPPAPVWRALWELWVRVGLPGAGRIVSPGWAEVGRFLGPSIRGFYERYPLRELARLWAEAGIEDVRWRSLSLGGGVVIVGAARLSAESRPAFYALAPGQLARLRDAAAPAVHALAPLLRRDRRGARDGLRARAARRGARRLRARHGRRRARARRAAGAPARDADPAARARGRSPWFDRGRRRDRRGERAGLDALAAAARRVRRVHRRARTTSSSGAAGSTATSGSASRGERCPSSPPTS